jgi:hypothetical protein
MGDINPSKMPGKKVIHRKDKPNDVDVYAKGGKVWETPNPKKKHKHLSSAKKAAAKASAKKAGRPYPNLIDNMKVMK